MYYTHARAQCLALPIDDTGADPEIGHGGLNFDRFFRIKTTNLYTHKAQKTEQILHNQPKINNFWKSCKKQEKLVHFLRAPCKMLQFCKFAPEAQEKFAIFSLKYGHGATQNGGRGADGGGWRPLAPPP